jgi:hypothetical protein
MYIFLLFLDLSSKKGGEEMKRDVRHLVVSMLLLAILLGAIGCSNANAECKVTLDRSGKLDIIINPPGETGTSSQDGTLQRNLLISSSGGSINRVTNYVGKIVKTYAESGNEYIISVNISIEDKKLTAYELSVTGGVYGSTPHICQLP